jgi:hypothetical protein
MSPAGHVTEDQTIVGLFFSRFSKPNTRATAVFIDKLDAGGLQAVSDR